MNILNIFIISTLCLMSSLVIATPTNLSNLDRIDPEIATTFNVDSIEDFLALTPRMYKEMTGKKMSIKERVVLKITQKKIENSINPGIPRKNSIGKFLIYILCLLPPLALYLIEGTSGNFWLSVVAVSAALVLSILPIIGFLGGLLYILAIAHALLIALNHFGDI